MNEVYKTTGVLIGSVVEEPIPEAPTKGAVVKLERSGVCHSDAHLYNADLPRPSMPAYPLVLGHEIAGIIHSLGEDTSEGEEVFSVGDRVVVYPWGGCRKCWSCKQGSHHCANRRGPDTHGYGIQIAGGFQQYVSVKSRWSLVKLPEQIPFSVGCLAPCSAVTAYHALQEIQQSVTYAIQGKGSANVVFVGAGGLSLWATEMIKAIYQDKVKLLVADLQEEKLADIREQGADKSVLWKKEDPAASRAAAITETMGGQVDAVVDFVGISSSVEAVFPTLTLNSTYAVVGIFGGSMPPLPLMKIATANIRIQGIYTGSKANVQELFKLWIDKNLKGPPITNIALKDVGDVMKNMLEGKVVKGRAVIGFKTEANLQIKEK